MERIKKEEEEAERKRIEEELKKQEIERLKREEALKKEKKKGKNQTKQQKQNQQQKQVTNSKTQQITKQQLQQNTQSSKKKNKQSQGNSNKETVSIKKDEKCKKDDVEGAKMVTIKRDSDSSKVTITFRGAVEDDVLCTLYDNEGEIICNNFLFILYYYSFDINNLKISDSYQRTFYHDMCFYVCITCFNLHSKFYVIL